MEDWQIKICPIPVADEYPQPTNKVVGDGYVSTSAHSRMELGYKLFSRQSISSRSEDRQIHICPISVADEYPQPTSNIVGDGYASVAREGGICIYLCSRENGNWGIHEFHAKIFHREGRIGRLKPARYRLRMNIRNQRNPSTSRVRYRVSVPFNPASQLMLRDVPLKSRRTASSR